MREVIKNIIKSPIIAKRVLQFIDESGCSIDITKESNNYPTYIFMRKTITISDSFTTEYYHVAIEYNTAHPDSLYIAIQKNDSKNLLIKRYYYPETLGTKLTSVIFYLLLDYFRIAINEIETSKIRFEAEYPYRKVNNDQ